jgi:hypothetical protein
MAMACSQLEPVVVGDTVSLYFAAANFPHSADTARGDAALFQVGTALATLKRDRFASLETSVRDPGPCRVVTRPFIVRHPRLFLNAATWETVAASRKGETGTVTSFGGSAALAPTCGTAIVGCGGRRLGRHPGFEYLFRRASGFMPAPRPNGEISLRSSGGLS